MASAYCILRARLNFFGSVDAASHFRSSGVRGLRFSMFFFGNYRSNFGFRISDHITALRRSKSAISGCSASDFGGGAMLWAGVCVPAACRAVLPGPEAFSGAVRSGFGRGGCFRFGTGRAGSVPGKNSRGIGQPSGRSFGSSAAGSAFFVRCGRFFRPAEIASITIPIVISILKISSMIILFYAFMSRFTLSIPFTLRMRSITVFRLSASLT